MTERDWDSCDEPEKLLKFLADSRKATDRKLRLFACGCVRRVWHLLTHERSREAVEVGERFADGLAGDAERDAAWDAALNAAWHDFETTSFAEAVAELAVHVADPAPQPEEALGVADILAAVRVYGPDPDAAAEDDATRAAYTDACKKERAGLAHLLRDIFGAIAGPLPGASALLAWNDGLILRLAQAAYEERRLPSGELDNARLAVLCDALEDAGCDNAGLLGHLRGEGPHWRGCFAVDHILGRSHAPPGMSQGEWAACGDPVRMVRAVRGRVSGRKLHLFAVASWRRGQRFLEPGPQVGECRHALETTERFADGLATEEELRRASHIVHVGLTTPDGYSAAHTAATYQAGATEGQDTSPAALAAEAAAHAELLREVLGDVFAPARLEPAWLSANDGAAVAIARRIYDERAFGLMSVLGDALEEAGCSDRRILDHCRERREHTRGCWVVDLCLGLE